MKNTLLLLKQVLITIGFIFMGVRCLTFFLVIVVFLYLTLKYRPYTRRSYSDLECFSLVVTMITIYLGVFFISDSTQFDEDYDRTTKYGWTGNKAARNFFFAVILISNCVFLVYWLYLTTKDFRAKLRNSHGIVYLTVCLCRN